MNAAFHSQERGTGDDLLRGNISLPVLILMEPIFIVSLSQLLTESYEWKKGTFVSVCSALSLHEAAAAN